MWWMPAPANAETNRLVAVSRASDMLNVSRSVPVASTIARLCTSPNGSGRSQTGCFSNPNNDRQNSTYVSSRPACNAKAR